MSTDEIEQAKRWFGEWRSATEVYNFTQSLAQKLFVLPDAVGNGERENPGLFRQPDTDFIHEMRAAALFCHLRKGRAIRRCQGLRPDFELQMQQDEVELFEFTEVQEKERRRGEEILAMARSGIPLTHVDAPPDKADVIRTIIDGIQIKIKKARSLEVKGIPYPAGTNLLVYINLSKIDADWEDLKKAMPAVVKSAASYFSQIWLYWQGELLNMMSGDRVP